LVALRACQQPHSIAIAAGDQPVAGSLDQDVEKAGVSATPAFGPSIPSHWSGEALACFIVLIHEMGAVRWRVPDALSVFSGASPADGPFPFTLWRAC
jgi:hypothetical protein